MDVISERVKITEEVLYENGYILKGLEYFFHPDTKIVVKLVTTKTGKHFFSNNTRGVKYTDQLFPSTEGQKIKVSEKYIPFKNQHYLRVKAFKGDALIAFFSRELICKSTDIFGKHDENVDASKIVSNQYLMEVCISLGVQRPSGRLPNSYGTYYEAKIYDIYCEEGFNAAFQYFKDTVFEYYKNNFPHLK